MTLSLRLRLLLPSLAAALPLLFATPGSSQSSPAAQEQFTKVAAPAFRDYCFKCHGERKTKARLNLEQISAAPDFASLFKTWEKVIGMVEKREMPPEDSKQPSDSERQALVSVVRNALDEYIRKEQGDPGRIALRRLTSAEYAYSIEDLTGLDLGLERTFISDAVGGEGFSNVGDVQFIQDSTLEHYLEAAKLVAAHAVIGAGPLHFYSDPGKTGQELSAIRRIQSIYQKHGFRTASGEGGKEFGLDRYPKAFFAAWRYKHRSALHLEGSLTDFAHREGLDAPFLQYVWQTLQSSDLPFPASEIVRAWEQLPAPAVNNEGTVRAECEKLYDLLQAWQICFAENTGDAEVASVLTETSFKPSPTNAFRIRLGWPAGTTNAKFQLTVAPAFSGDADHALVLWRQPSLRFRKAGAAQATGRRARGTPLRESVSESTANRLNFGQSAGLKNRAVGTNDFVTSGAVTHTIEFAIPPEATQAELLMEAELEIAESAHDRDCVMRCLIEHDLNEGATAAATGTFSLLLANPNGRGIDRLKAGVAQFARAFPQISHREAAPADRDPIPPPFNSDYNNPERNHFHAAIKYHRDDQFLTEHVLESDARRELDQAWTDLLTAFDYHDLWLSFIAKKFKLDPAELSVAALTPERVAKIPGEPRPFVEHIYNQYIAATNTLHAAEAGHVNDALEFARNAWRRPLSESEKEKLRSFYHSMRAEVDHPSAMQALLARILVSPAFLYRIETMPGVTPNSLAQNSTSGRVALTDWEMASRLSYFLWGSVPDAELWRAAAAHELETPDQLAAQARRMLRDPKARRFATEFFGQWFGFYRFDGYRGVDTTRFSEFTDSLKASLYDEAVSFFEHIVREDRPVHDILFADYSFLNVELAHHYDVQAGNLPTNALAKIDGVNSSHRGGLLRLGAVLTSTSAPLRTSAVKRGDWILRRVLGQGVPPPPGDAGSIPPDDVLADGKTVRQRLEAHRRDPSCVNCHARMDPLGFALEHFDSIGRWRDTYRDGQKIDASGKLNDGTEISEFEGLNQYLLVHESSFNRTLCAKLLGFALGRAELASDRPLLDQMVSGLQADNHFSTLVLQIVASPQFRYRRANDISSTAPRHVALQEKTALESKRP